jgi:hypothetical protein
MGFCASFEVTHGILWIFGRSSWDFVHIWKFFMRFCAFLEVPHHEELPNMHKTPPGSSKNAQNPMRNFQKGTKSHIELPKMHKIP